MEDIIAQLGHGLVIGGGGGGSGMGSGIEGENGAEDYDDVEMVDWEGPEVEVELKMNMNVNGSGNSGDNRNNMNKSSNQSYSEAGKSLLIDSYNCKLTREGNIGNGNVLNNNNNSNNTEDIRSSCHASTPTETQKELILHTRDPRKYFSIGRMPFWYKNHMRDSRMQVSPSEYEWSPSDQQDFDVEDDTDRGTMLLDQRPEPVRILSPLSTVQWLGVVVLGIFVSLLAADVVRMRTILIGRRSLERETCYADWSANGCHRAVPALAEECSRWKSCWAVEPWALWGEAIVSALGEMIGGGGSRSSNGSGTSTATTLSLMSVMTVTVVVAAMVLGRMGQSG